MIEDRQLNYKLARLKGRGGNAAKASKGVVVGMFAYQMCVTIIVCVYVLACVIVCARVCVRAYLLAFTCVCAYMCTCLHVYIFAVV